MEQTSKKSPKLFKSLPFSMKMMISTVILLLCSNFLILVIVCGMAYRNLENNAKEQMQSQLEVSLSAVSNSMNDVINLMTNASTRSEIQDLLKKHSMSAKDLLDTENRVNETLRVIKSSYSMIEYAALVPAGDTVMFYNGEPVPNPYMKQTFLNSFAESEYLTFQSTSGYLLKDCYPSTVLNLYVPIYEERLKGDSLAGILVVGINVETMEELYTEQSDDINMRIIINKGIVTASGHAEEIGSEAEFFDSYTAESGELDNGNDIICYHWDEDKVWCADVSIPKAQLYGSVTRTAVEIAIIIILFTLAAVAISLEMARHFYSPMREMLATMNRISDGSFGLKMKDYPEADFHQISASFNSMIDSIQSYMEENQRKEKENTEIRLNALQSQIKPHFLYNTLECIHWQALLENAPESSKMVMELSRYYRLCLSKGAEFVTLRQELEHTRSYVAIQNMRFDNLFDVTYDVDEDLMGLEIPKITLQPLVENSIYHGIKPREDEVGHIRISGRLLADKLILKVADDGIGMTQDQIDHLNQTIGELVNDGSYGLKNVHKRLEIKYGPGNGLYYQKNESGGITVTVTLPQSQSVK